MFKGVINICLLFFLSTNLFISAKAKENFHANSNKLKQSSSEIGFLENKGQIVDQDNRTNSLCKYLLNLENFKVQLRKNGFSYEVIKTEIQENQNYKSFSFNPVSETLKAVPKNIIYKIHRIDIDFINANEHYNIVAEEKSEDYNNYYTSTNEFLDVHHYQKIIYKNIYNGIDIEFISNKFNSFKYNFIIHPGADPNQIRLKINGADNNHITSIGNILIQTAYGKIEETLPLSYQLENKEKVNVTFKKTQENEYGVSIQNYNPNTTLIVDPIPNRVWGTFCGGTGDEVFYDCKLHYASGNIYTTGNTRSTNAIATAGAYQTSFGGTGANGFDAFLVVFNTNGVRQWGTYYGGAGDDDARGCSVVQSNGDVYIVGKTTSTNGIATPGAHQTTYGGGGFDVFVAKFNASGTRLWGTYYGGSDFDNVFDCDTDVTGNIYVVGETGSANGIATGGSHQTVFAAGGFDGFLVKFNPAGVRQWATYYGGTGSESAQGCSVGATGNIFISGNTTSTTAISTVGVHQAAIGGSLDGFLVKFNNNGVRQWATYFGGTAVDAGTSCVVDPSDNVFMAGISFSNTGISTAGSFQVNYGAGMDAFLTKFNGNGTQLWGTYIGANLDQYVNEVFLNPSGSNIYIAGITGSMPTLTTANTHQGTYGGGLNDAFLGKFNTNGVRQWCTFYGGTGRDAGTSGTAASNGDVYLAGETESTNAISTPGAHQVTFGGGFGAIQDAFVVKFSECNVSFVQSPTICSNSSFTLPGGNIVNTQGTYYDTINLSAGCDSVVTTILTVKPDTNITQSASICNGGNYTLPGGTIVTTQGVYFDTLQTIFGCDSIITTNLTVGTTINSSQNPTICSGGNFILPSGTPVNTSGTYIDTIQASTGCDSIITTNLTVNANYSNTQTINICTGNNYTLPSGAVVNTSGTYIDTLNTINGCDSIITTQLIVSSSITINQTINICFGNTYTLPGGAITSTSGTYNDTLLSSGGCDSIITTILNINPLPTVSVSPNITINQGSSTILTATGNGTNYNWSPSNGLSSTVGASVSASPNNTTTYCVVATNANGCTSSACVTVTILEIPCPSNENLDVPNAFSPNNDGLNDMFCLQGWDLCLENFSIFIFNRWGEKVFESKDPNFCWDGTFRNNTMDSQVFVYYIKARFINHDKPIIKKGNISLIK